MIKKMTNAAWALWKRWLDARAAARARRELSALSDHMLKDIGLSRGPVDSLSRLGHE